MTRIPAMAAVVLAVLVSSVTAAPAAQGFATWYDDPNRDGLYAAAGPALRVGDWRGDTVRVSAGGRSVTVRLVDFCACGDRHGTATVIDLSSAAFRRLAPLSQGLVRVTVERVGSKPAPALPQTDMEAPG